MRLIDADALMESAGLFHINACARGCGKSILHLAKAWLSNEVAKAQTIDAVPVVRCGDCIYSDEAWVNEKGFLICPASGMDIAADDFCSYGERKVVE